MSDYTRNPFGFNRLEHDINNLNNLYVRIYRLFMDKEQLSTIKRKYQALGKVLNERQRRLWAAAEARALGNGGVTVVAKATGLSRTTIYSGLEEINADSSSLENATTSVRRKGGGRKPLVYHQPKILAALENLMQPTTGAAESPFRWTCKSIGVLVKEITGQGYAIGDRTIVDLLRRMRYHVHDSPQISKMSPQSDRDYQFETLNLKAMAFLRSDQPVIFVEVREKCIKQNFKNAGQDEYLHTESKTNRKNNCKTGELIDASSWTDDDSVANYSWVNVGINNKTADAAANCILDWWKHTGHLASPNANTLLILSDIYAFNKTEPMQWIVGVQQLANSSGLTVHVSHLPQAIFKLTTVLHRLITTRDWHNESLTSYSYQTLITTIGNAMKSSEIGAKANLARRIKHARPSVSVSEFAKIEIKFEKSHGDYSNYAVAPDQSVHFISEMPS